MRSVSPPAFGGLCRLKPAFQEVPATLGLGVQAGAAIAALGGPAGWSLQLAA